MQSFLTASIFSICAGSVVAGGPVEVWATEKDCSFVGLDWAAPAPTPEGNSLLSAVISFETFDDALYPYSEVIAFDCNSEAGIKASWNTATVAADVVEQLRLGPVAFDAWKAGIASAGHAEMVGAEVAHGTMTCACELHYGIEVLQ